MSRQRMAPGEWGSVTYTGQAMDDNGKYRTAPEGTHRPDRWRARAKVRDLDGRTRDVERYGKTKTAARTALETELRNRVTPSPGEAELTPNSTFRQVAEAWRSELMTDDRRASGTRRVYLSTLDLHVLGTEAEPSPIANLALRELRVSTLQRLLRDVANDHGQSAAKMTRSVLSLVLGLAVRHDAMAHNLVRSMGHTPTPTRKREPKRDNRRAFTRAERDQLVTLADTDARARVRDLGDLVAFMAGTGVRIGEACALRWSDLDLDNGTATIAGTVVRVKGEGLVLQAGGKTDASHRTVALPSWLVARLLARQVRSPRNPWDVVLVSPLGKLRDPSNTSHDLRELMDSAGFTWASAHTFRRTVATLLDAAGVSARETANQLGHANPSITQRVYMSRRTTTQQAASIL